MPQSLNSDSDSSESLPRGQLFAFSRSPFPLPTPRDILYFQMTLPGPRGALQPNYLTIELICFFQMLDLFRIWSIFSVLHLLVNRRTPVLYPTPQHYLDKFYFLFSINVRYH